MLTERRWDGFWRGRGAMLITVLRLVASTAVQDFAARQLTIVWQNVMTKAFLRCYLSRISGYYRLRLTGSVSNPEHRIDRDVKLVAVETIELLKPSQKVSPQAAGSGRWGESGRIGRTWRRET